MYRKPQRRKWSKILPKSSTNVIFLTSILVLSRKSWNRRNKTKKLLIIELFVVTTMKEENEDNSQWAEINENILSWKLKSSIYFSWICFVCLYKTLNLKNVSFFFFLLKYKYLNHFYIMFRLLFSLMFQSLWRKIFYLYIFHVLLFFR